MQNNAIDRNDTTGSSTYTQAKASLRLHNCLSDLLPRIIFLYSLLWRKNAIVHRDYVIKGSDKVQDKLQNKPQINRKINRKINRNDCTLDEQAIIQVIANNPQTTQKEIAKAIGKSERNTHSIMVCLQKKGIIERSGSKKTGIWIVNRQT